MNTSTLVDLAGTGATWVLYFLIGLSAIQLAIILERAVVFTRTRAPRQLRDRVRRALADGGTKAVILATSNDRSLEARVAASAAGSADRGLTAMQEIAKSTAVDERLKLERGLSFLGTLGNNAPFIGLFGTVLGVIDATAHLTGQHNAQVMSGISEALISTAVGLLVALPAVAAFNYFQRILKTRTVAADALTSELVAHVVSPTSSRKAA